MSITINSVTTYAVSGGGANISVTTPSASVGDLLLIILSNDYYSLSEMGLNSITPTATATQITDFTADGGANQPHIKAWWAPVVTAGAVTVSATTGHTDEEKALVVYILSGADTTSPIDAAANSGAVTSAQSAVAPAVSPSASTDLLFCHMQTDGAGHSTTYTTPGSMTAQYSLTDGVFMQAIGASEQLSASGSTGTRTFTGDRTNGWVASSVAIKTAAAAEPYYVQSTNNGNSAAGTTLSAAFTSNVTAGNLIVAAVGYASDTVTATLSDTLGNTYNVAIGPTDSATLGFRQYIFWTVANSSGANTLLLTLSSGVSFRRLTIHEYTNVNALDAATGAIGSSGAPNSGSVTTSYANELIFGWAESNHGTTTAGSGFTLRETCLSESTEDKAVTSTGSYSAIYPSDGTAWMCQVATFYKSSGPNGGLAAWFTA